LGHGHVPPDVRGASARRLKLLGGVLYNSWGFLNQLVSVPSGIKGIIKRFKFSGFEIHWHSGSKTYLLFCCFPAFQPGGAHMEFSLKRQWQLPLCDCSAEVESITKSTYINDPQHFL